MPDTECLILEDRAGKQKQPGDFPAVLAFSGERFPFSVSILIEA
jgi:hypothetical protein